MSEMLAKILSEVPWTGILEFMIDIYLKAAIVCALAGLLTVLLRRSSAYVRSVVWVFALLVLLLLPLAHVISPIWNLPILPEVGSWWQKISRSEQVAVSGDKVVEEGSESAGNVPRGTGIASAGTETFSPGWQAWTFFALLMGTIISLSWLLVRAAVAERILKRSESVDVAWHELLVETSSVLGLERRIRLFESGDIKAAITVGAFNPAIVVPSGSSEWSAERRRYILSHELAHIKRWDGLIEVLVLVVKSVFWLNPMVWLAVRNLRVERERDCDDAVLNTGARPSDYAMFLMDIAAELGMPPRPMWQLSTISQGSNLKDRIMCILDPKINRNRNRRRTVVVACFLLASLILPLSISGIWETKAQDKSDKQKQEELEKKKKMQHEKQMAEKKMTAEEKIKLGWEKISTRENSAAVLVHDKIVAKGTDAGYKVVQKLKESGTDKYYFKEGEFNTLGYYFMHQDKIKEAVTVFEINVKLYPEAWNTYDSMGEALMVAGKLEKSRKYYQKSMALNPENENGQKMLAKLDELEKTGEKVASQK